MARPINILEATEIAETLLGSQGRVEIRRGMCTVYQGKEIMGRGVTLEEALADAEARVRMLTMMHVKVENKP